MAIPGYTAAANPKRTRSFRQVTRSRLALGGLVDPGGILNGGDVVIPAPQPSGECVRPDCDQCAANALDGSGVPVYGNYCGPQHGGTGEPIDAVDAACKRHDECYGELGYFDCRCDAQLLEELPAAIAQTGSAQGKLCGGAIYTWFSLQPCACYTEVCYPTFGWCQESVRYPCRFRTKWCRKWGVRYPCGITYDWCTYTFDYPCYTGIECSDIPYAFGAGGVSPCSLGRLLPGGVFATPSLVRAAATTAA